jgi:hypothetical protein
MKKTFVIILLVFLNLACAKNTEMLSNDAEQLAKLETEINELIKDKSCGNDRICGVIGFGSKACGGNLKFLVYSLNSSNEKILVDKVTTYNELQKTINIKTGAISDCSLAIKPEVICKNGICTSK